MDRENNKLSKHKSDPYGDLRKPGEGKPITEPPIPAATVVLLRDGDKGVETLMLRKNKDIGFGGMWVFPGGRIDDADYGDSDDRTAAARRAAAREANEEAGVDLDPEDFIWFSHWTPPPITPKRFTTWFFAAHMPYGQEIVIDGGEIHDHRWINPAEAIELHSARQIDFVPPTWVTLHYLASRASSTELLAHFDKVSPKIYETHLGKTEQGHRVALWHGDAGYEAWDAGIAGERHRLVMAKDGFIFENTIEQY
ncbi:MAG TPA: NUDIX hydrolase [Porticoccaceae bacterium]|nr:NUDIX hydrolase [Porticoccaceae bacterium]